MPSSPSQNQGQMNPPAFNIGNGNIKTFFSPHTKPGSQPTLDIVGWKKKNIVRKGRPLLNFGTILTYLSTVP